MDLIALLGSHDALAETLASFTATDFHLHQSSKHAAAADILQGLEPLKFAGAAVLEPALQQAVLAQVDRPSLSAEAAGAVDTVIVTAAGLIGEYTLGQAVGDVLLRSDWNARGARGVILGGGAEASAIARELSSLGLEHVALFAASPAEAEQSMPHLAATTKSYAGSLKAPQLQTFLEAADVLVRVQPNVRLAAHYLGPHLTVIDLSAEVMSELRDHAIRVGAKTFSLTDIWAHRLALIFGHILGRKVSAEPFLALFHTQTV